MQTLHTLRLTLRPILEQDFLCYYQLYSSKQVMRFIGPVWDKVQAWQEFQVYLEPWLDEEQQWLSFVILDKESGDSLGIIGTQNKSTYCSQREFGFMLLPHAQGHGYAKEAAQAVLDYTFATLASHKICANVDKRNLASRHVLESLGFKLDGVLRDNFLMDGQWVDDYAYSLLYKEYSL